MDYAQLLSKYITESGLSLSDIAKAVTEKKGVKIDKSYISKIKNKHVNPPSDEITLALAEITGGDPKRLIMASYIEKAPEEIKNLLKNAEDVNDLLYDLFVIDHAILRTEESSEYAKYPNFDVDVEVEIASSPIYYFDKLTLENKLLILNEMFDYAKNKGIKIEDLLKKYGIRTNNLYKGDGATVIPYYKKTPDPLENEKEFVSKIELSDEELVKQFKLSVDGRELSEKEFRRIIAQVRMERQLDQ